MKITSFDRCIVDTFLNVLFQVLCFTTVLNAFIPHYPNTRFLIVAGNHTNFFFFFTKIQHFFFTKFCSVINLLCFATINQTNCMPRYNFVTE